MKQKNLKLCLLALGALAWGTAQASTLPDLAKASGCFSCHSIQEKVVGPSFASVAEKYAGQPDAAADLARSVQNGSSRKWGRAAMPAHPNMDPAEIQKLAEWVLTLKP
ncbi:MAG: c-type cytochrome [Burkholderiales bacterium]|jgi:cytochrome c|nr:c-type cytochrome [Burkholderiales bacterium]